MVKELVVVHALLEWQLSLRKMYVWLPSHRHAGRVSPHREHHRLMRLGQEHLPGRDWSLVRAKASVVHCQKPSRAAYIP